VGDRGLEADANFFSASVLPILSGTHYDPQSLRNGIMDTSFTIHKNERARRGANSLKNKAQKVTALGVEPRTFSENNTYL
jgi:hypothetical protein